MGALRIIRSQLIGLFTGLAVRMYNACLWSYPSSFRDEYGPEMQLVFKQAMQEAGGTGWRMQCALFLRELIDHPACLLRAHLAESHRKEARMSLDSDLIKQESLLRPADDGKPGSRQDALLAALPMVTVGLLAGGLGFLTATAIKASYGWQVFVKALETSLAVLLVLSILGMTILAWRRRWPRWFASWMPFLLVPLVALINWPLQSMGYYWIQNIFLYIQFPLALALLVVAVGQSDRLRGLLVTLPILPLLWNVPLEFTIVAYRNLVTLLAWLLGGLAGALILHKGSVRYGLWLALGYNLFVGLMYSWARTYYNNIPLEHVSIPPGFEEFISRAFSGFLALSTLLLAPMLVWAIRRLGLQSGKRGIVGYNLALVGLFLELAGYLGSFWWQASVHPYQFYASGSFPGGWGALIRGLTYLGMVVYLGGMGLLAVAASQRKTMPGRLDFILLALIPLALPLMGTAPMLFNFSNNPPSMPYEIGGLRDMPLALLYTLGGIWLLIGSWLASRRRWMRSANGGNAGG